MKNTIVVLMLLATMLTNRILAQSTNEPITSKPAHHDLAHGAKQLGQFYEMLSSSPTTALTPGQTMTHVRRTLYLTGPEPALNAVALATLGLTLDEIETAMPKH